MIRDHDCFKLLGLRLKSVFPAALCMVLVLPSVLWAGCGAEQTAGEFQRGGALESGGQVSISIPTSASQRVEVALSITPTDNSAAITWQFRSETGLLIDTHSEAAYSNESFTDEAYGDVAPCGNPAFFILKSDFGTLLYTLTFRYFERPGWNAGRGLDFTSAQAIPPAKTFCGSINYPIGVCDNRHYFKVVLKPGETLQVNGTLTSDTMYGAQGMIEVRDESYDFVENILNVPVYDTVAAQDSFTNESGFEQTYYLIKYGGPAYHLRYEIAFRRDAAWGIISPIFQLLLNRSK